MFRILASTVNALSSLCWYADEPLEITYSYWDGAGHRRVLQVFLDFKILLLYFPTLLALILSQISLGLEWIQCPDLSSISLSLGCLGWFAGQERRLHSWILTSSTASVSSWISRNSYSFSWKLAVCQGRSNHSSCKCQQFYLLTFLSFSVS
jgi:hypothetical protein